MFRGKERQPIDPGDIAKQVAKDVFQAGQITVEEFEELMGLHAHESLLRSRPTIPGQSDRLTFASTYFGQLNPDGTNTAVSSFQRIINEELQARRALGQDPTRGHNRWSIPRIAFRLPHIPKAVRSEIAAVAVSAAVVTGGVHAWDFVYTLHQAPETRITQGCENLADGIKIPDHIEVKDPEMIKQACRTLARDIVLNRMDSTPKAQIHS